MLPLTTTAASHWPEFVQIVMCQAQNIKGSIIKERNTFLMGALTGTVSPL
jgi:hypothetical protein